MSACNRSALGWLMPASQSWTVRRLVLTRAASSSWVRPVRPRWRSSRLRNGSASRSAPSALTMARLRTLVRQFNRRVKGKAPFLDGVLVSTGRVDVDVDAVFERLWLGHGHEHQRWRAAHLAADFNFALRPAIDHLIVEHPRPEVGHAPGVGAIDHQLREATSH